MFQIADLQYRSGQIDQVIHILRQEQGASDGGGEDSTPRYRRHSRVRSKSALDLTALDAAVTREQNGKATDVMDDRATEDKSAELKKE